MELIDFSLNIGGKTIIENCNIKFKLGITHILGNNGCGKTTLAKACSGLAKYNGTIIGNDNVLLLSSFTNVPQDLSLKDVETLLLKKFDKEKMEYFKNKLDLNNIMKNISIKKLSDGQKQKIKIFCYLLSEPDVIFLDEVTTSLDKKTSNEIYEFLNDLRIQNTKTVINITHNLSDIEYVKGEYILIKDRNILKFDNKEDLINMYMKG